MIWLHLCVVFFQEATDHQELQYHKIIANDCRTGKVEICAKRHRSACIRKTYLPREHAHDEGNLEPTSHQEQNLK